MLANSMLLCQWSELRSMVVNKANASHLQFDICLAPSSFHSLNFSCYSLGVSVKRPGTRLLILNDACIPTANSMPSSSRTASITQSKWVLRFSQHTCMLLSFVPFRLFCVPACCVHRLFDLWDITPLHSTVISKKSNIISTSDLMLLTLNMFLLFSSFSFCAFLKLLSSLSVL